MAIKKRCTRCLKPLREDGTCQNKACVRYVEPKAEAEESKEEEKEEGK